MSFKNIHIVNLISDAHFIKSQLEAEEIPVILVGDEPLNSDYNYKESISILVQESDFKHAESILIRLGFIEINVTSNTVLDDIDNLTMKMPIIKKWDYYIRIFTFFILAIILFLTLIISMIPDF